MIDLRILIVVLLARILFEKKASFFIGTIRISSEIKDW
jgi:hypothetical protein